MLSLIRSELLKMRHTFSLKLVILAPIVTLLLGYLLSGNSVHYDITYCYCNMGCKYYYL